MILLLNDPEQRERVARVRQYAEQPENVYNGDQGIPGHNYRCNIDVTASFRVRVTYTISLGTAPDGRPIKLRHLTLLFYYNGDPVDLAATPPLAAEEIAFMFGFTGGLREWQIEPSHHSNNGVVFLQPYEKAS